MIDRIGQHFGHYQLIQVLGQGRWASVYLGEHRHLHTQAAIKVLHDPLAAGEVEGFLTEARTLARLRHPHIVRLLDFGLEDDTPFLVIDYAPGGTLRKLHPKGAQLPLETVIPYVKQVAEGLQYAHAQRLIHRDLKPENLLLGPDQEIWLSDFGLAIIAHSAHSQPLQQTAGTLAYMAPEQLQGHPTPASDQYALGVLVYEWLCGECPFAGSFAEVAHKQLSLPPPSLREQVPTLPVAVEYVVLKALAKDPSQRFAGVHDFALALEASSKAESSSRETQLIQSSPYLAASGQSTRHNLPTPLTSLIGREQEVTTACLLLRHLEVRLLTITGTGGVGKTRLALQIAKEVRDNFADGVSFISLAPLRDPSLVLPTIAQMFGLRERIDHPPLTLLQALLRDKRLLLFLDNFEQVVTAAPLLVEVLRACPHLKILVTSRTLLRVSGEQEFLVPPLAVPDLKQLPALEALSHYAAVELFLQRAQALRPSIQLTSTNARPIAEICVRLDGLPLAIELAAARITLLSPQALLTRLSQRFQVLTSGTRDAPARQQTLRNTMEWSYHLLDAREQRLFRRLSVFVGGCTLETIEALSLALDGEAGHVLDGVASLIDKCLLHQTEQGKEEPRLIMLETIREYGLECLAVQGEMETVHQAYTAYYLTLAEEAKPELQGPQQVLWLERLEQEHGNLRKVLWGLLEQEEIEQALRLGIALARFWEVHGHLSEGYQWLDRALASSQNVAPSLRAWGLNEAAWFAHLQSKTDQAENLLHESLSLFGVLDDKRGKALALRRRGLVARTRGKFAEAGTWAQEARLLFNEVGDRGGAAHVLLLEAYIAIDQADYVKAGMLLEECLSVFGELGDKRRTALVSVHLARVLFAQGDLVSASPLAQEGLALAKSLGDKETLALGLSLFGKIALHQNDVATARSLFAESLAFSRERGHQSGIAEAVSLLARAATMQGDDVTARVLFEECVVLCAGIGKINIATCLEGLADLFLSLGERVWAVRLWSKSNALRAAIGTPLPIIDRPNYEHAVATARSLLGEKTFAATWAQGRSITLTDVLAALTALPRPVPTELRSAPSTTKRVTYPAGLTVREVEVLRLVAQGLTDAQVAEQLVISPSTVNSHLKSIYGKLHVTSRSAATRYAIEHNLM